MSDGRDAAETEGVDVPTTPRLVKADARGRVALGAAKAGKKYNVEFWSDGVVVLRPTDSPAV